METAVGARCADFRVRQVIAILDRLGISREAVVIPLSPVHPGGVRVLPNGKLEIQVESETPFERWLPELERMIADVMASG